MKRWIVKGWKWKLTPVDVNLEMEQPAKIYDVDGSLGGIQYGPDAPKEAPSDSCPICTINGIHSHSVEEIKMLKKWIAYLESKLGVQP